MGRRPSSHEVSGGPVRGGSAPPLRPSERASREKRVETGCREFQRAANAIRHVWIPAPPSHPLETAGLRFRLPEGVRDIPQTGLYSLFALAGDCEATLTYELLNVPPPRTGYGSGVGLAFDIEGGGGRGAIQRVFRITEGSGCVVQTTPGESHAGMKDVDRFVPAASRGGRMGLRRVQNELIFLSADAPADPLREIDRLPFTDRTIRAVRVFADAGGSPTAVDVRLRQIDIRAEEIADGVPQREPRQWSWAWLWVSCPGRRRGFVLELASPATFVEVAGFSRGCRGVSVFPGRMRV